MKIKSKVRAGVTTPFDPGHHAITQSAPAGSISGKYPTSNG
jgi:hypothetical protein